MYWEFVVVVVAIVAWSICWLSIALAIVGLELSVVVEPPSLVAIVPLSSWGLSLL